MIALLFSVLLALYLLGPDLLARWLLGFVVPRKAVVQSRSEEITRAAIWSACPLLIALRLTQLQGIFPRYGGTAMLKTFFAGLYSEAMFRNDPNRWFQSASAILHMNLAVLFWMYAVVIAASLALMLLTRKYATIRHGLPYGFPRDFLARLVLPRVAEWHVLLSDMLLPTRDLSLFADILTRSGLYRGLVQDKVLGPDGGLRSITLGEPRRFQREQYLAAREKHGTADAETFWRTIPGDLFLIVGSEVLNLNLQYIARSGNVVTPTRQQKDALRELLAQLPDAS